MLFFNLQQKTYKRVVLVLYTHTQKVIQLHEQSLDRQCYWMLLSLIDLLSLAFSKT